MSTKKKEEKENVYVRMNMCLYFDVCVSDFTIYTTQAQAVAADQTKRKRKKEEEGKEN